MYDTVIILLECYKSRNKITLSETFEISSETAKATFLYAFQSWHYVGLLILLLFVKDIACFLSFKKICICFGNVTNRCKQADLHCLGSAVLRKLLKI